MWVMDSYIAAWVQTVIGFVGEDSILFLELLMQLNHLLTQQFTLDASKFHLLQLHELHGCLHQFLKKLTKSDTAFSRAVGWINDLFMLYSVSHWTHPDSLDPLHKLVITGKHQFGGKFPEPRLGALREVALQSLLMVLISVPVGIQDITGFPDLFNCFFNLSFENLSRIKESASLFNRW